MRARCSSVKSGWSRMLVRKNVAPPPTPMSCGQHQAEDLAGIPHVDQVHRVVAQQRHDERVEHPDEVAHGRAGDGGRTAPREHVVELARLAGDRAVRVDHALRVLGGARGERDERRGVGVDRRRGARSGRRRARRRTAWRRRGARSAAVSPTTSHGGPGRSARTPSHDARWSTRPKRSGGDDDGRVGGVDDVRHLLGAVEVHDRHHDGAEVGGGPERDRRPPPSSAAAARPRHPGPTPSAGEPRRRRIGRPGRRRRWCRDQGRTFDRTWNSVAPRRPSPAATIDPSVPSSHHPSSRYCCASSLEALRSVHSAIRPPFAGGA